MSLLMRGGVARRMPPLRELVQRARSGDLAAYGEVVEATRSTVYAVAAGILRDHASAQDAVQEAYLRAFRRLDDLEDPDAFVGWLRRIVVTVAMNARRGRRATLLRLDDVPEIPVLDEAETVWSEVQRQRLAAALLTLTKKDRRLCDRHYHGRWSVARLAEHAGVREPAMRKRLHGAPTEVLAWGFFKDEIVAHVGGDPSRHAAVGVGCGLERLAMLRYGIDDIRKIDVASVA